MWRPARITDEATELGPSMNIDLGAPTLGYAVRVGVEG
jgi:hypothetical protein